MNCFVLLFLLPIPTLAAAQSEAAVSTKDMQDCMGWSEKSPTLKINRVYQEFLRNLKPQQAAVLKRAQRTRSGAQSPSSGGFTPPLHP